jgi:undecaprenyl diphosphate synthase
MADALADIRREVPPPHRVIMDGNGRWAVKRGLERVKGHQEGAKSVRAVVTECARLRKEHGGPD